jgi:hypothetical protein
MDQPTRRPASRESWSRIVDKLLDEEVESTEELRVTVDDLEVEVPLSFGEDAQRATWRFDGTVNVSVDGKRGPLADWFALWLRDERERSTDDSESPR